MAFTVTARDHESSETTAVATETLGPFTPSTDSLVIVQNGGESDAFGSDSFLGNVTSSPTLTWTEQVSVDNVWWDGTISRYALTGGLSTTQISGAGSSTTITCDPSLTQNCYTATSAIDVTGHDTSTPIAQVASNSTADNGGGGSVSLAVTLGSTPTVGNLVVVTFQAGDDNGAGFAAPTFGGQAMTQVYNQASGSYCQSGLWYRVVTGDESTNVITCSDLGGSVGNGIGLALEIAAASAGGQNITPTGPTVSVTPGTNTVTQSAGGQAITPAGASVTVTAGTVTFGESIEPSGPTITVTPGTLTVTATQAIAPTGATVTATPGTATLYEFTGLFATTVNATTKQIEDQNGDPWFGVGDACWSLVGQLSPADIEVYFDGMAAAGVNFVMFSAPEPFYTDNTPAYRNQQGDLPFTGSNFASSLNNAYWTVVDDAVAYAGTLGITCFICPQYSGYAPSQDGWQDIISTQVGIDSSTFTDYGNDLATRYGSYPNIVWLIGHDDNTVAADMITASDLIIAALEAGTSHLWAFGSGNNSSGDSDWSGSTKTSDFNTTYTYSQDAGDETATDWSSKTTIYIEGYYEQEQGTEYERRDQMWAPWMEGASATIFGNNPRWHFESGRELYSFTGTWEASLTDTGTTQLGYLADFVAAVPDWGTTVPDTGGTFLTAGSGRARFDTATGIVYSTAGASITVDTTEMAGTDLVRIRRYDPTDGTFTTVATSEAQSAGRVITYPGTNTAGAVDYVYLIELSGAQPITPTGPTVTVTAGTVTVSTATAIAPTGPTVTATPGTVTVTTGNVDVDPSAPTISVTPGTVTVQVGASFITPTGPTVSVTPGTNTVTTGNVDITPAGATVTVTPGTNTVTQSGGGAQNVTPTGATVTVTAGTVTITTGNVDVEPAGPTVGVTAGIITITTGAVNVTPAGATVTVTAGTATVVQGLSVVPDGPTITVTPGTVTLTFDQPITPTGATATVTAGTLTVTTGSVDVTPAGPTVTATPGTITITTGNDLAPTGPTVTVTPGTVVVSVDQAFTLTGASVTVTPSSLLVGFYVAGAVVYVIPAEARTFTIRAESRILEVPDGS